MQIDFTPEEEAYRAGVRAWIAANLPEEWRGGDFKGPSDADHSFALQRDWERSLFKAGYAGVAWPRAYGGQGLTIVEQLIVNEEFGRAAAPEGVNTVGTELVGPVVLHAGSEAQKREFIPQILSLDKMWCQGFSEPEAGSDLASLRTTARQDGAEWVIDGQKVWIGHAHYADYCLVLARTDSTVGKHKGLSLLIVPMDAPGITVRPIVQITGRSEFNEIFLDAVRIPSSNCIGQPNEGWSIANRVLSTERGTMKLYRQARFVHEFEGLLALAGYGTLRGNEAGAAPFRQRLAAVYAELAIYRYHNLSFVSRVAAGETIGAEPSISKLFWSEMHQKMAALGLDVLGSRAAGMIEDRDPASRYQDLILDSRYETISAGTSQVQRNIIAERILGLPR